MISTTTILLAFLILLSMPVAAVLIFTGWALSDLYAFFPLMDALGEITWSASTEFVLVAIPLFIMMGEILLRSGMTDEMYRSVNLWVGRVPGGLMHTNIFSCALFAATSGSSVATTATMGTVTIPNIKKYGYQPSLFLGTIAAGGTLGILIPPSINMILYGILAETSVSTLYLAALIPGLLMGALFSIAVLVACLAKPEWDGDEVPRSSLLQKLAGLKGIIIPILLFGLVVGSIYAGVATPTEAAALGVMGALAVSLIKRRLTFVALAEVFQATIRTTSLVMLIVLAAYFLNFVITNIGLTDILTEKVSTLGWDPLYILFAIIGVYILLGCFMETLSLMIATTPIVVPIITALGFDPVWFGVLFMILLETALITPPIGMNLFIVQSVRGEGQFKEVIYGAAPFLLMMFVLIGLLIAFPQLALWLPDFVSK
ncbi:MAG TPA: TRAP transporter large permease subunit [Marinobacter sp.]|nr:TRAP transporter large permease subunit [Marinobacter sp.]